MSQIHCWHCPLNSGLHTTLLWTTDLSLKTRTDADAVALFAVHSFIVKLTDYINSVLLVVWIFPSSNFYAEQSIDHSTKFCSSLEGPAVEGGEGKLWKFKCITARKGELPDFQQQ
jgi:hypothetical protein